MKPKRSVNKIKKVRRSPKRAVDWTRVRLRLVAFVFLFALAALWVRAYHIQINRGPELSHGAERQYWAREQITGHRGQIFDREGVLLAKSVQVRSVYARPFEIRDLQGTSTKLAKMLGLPASKLYRDLKSKKHFVWVARKVSDKISRKIADADLPGVHQLVESERLYPHGHLAGQLLGFVGMDNHGLEGLELSFDEYLRGESVRNKVPKDARGQILYTRERRFDGIHGQDLRLTIDARIQSAAEDALARSIAKHKADGGMALVVEVKSGEILAWTNYPFFNPNAYKGQRPSRWRNKVAMDPFEPGSTMKPFLIAAALEEDICTPQSIFFCEKGKWRQKGFSINDTHEHEWLSVNRILSKSSNICASKIGFSLGAQTYYDYLRKFGFGEKSSLNLPGERNGLLRPPRQWYPVDLATASFGQGFSVTTLQLAQGYLVLANGGLATPLRIITNAGAEDKRERVVSEDVAKSVLRMMHEVVEDGTGSSVAIPGVKVGGKTGTAQKAVRTGGYGDEHISSFVGLLPIDDPQYLIIVVVDAPKDGYYGGLVAGPAVKEMALQTLSYRGQLPDEPVLKSADAQPLHDRLEEINYSEVRQAVTSYSGQGMPDLRGMSLRQAMEILARENIVPTLEGEGLFINKQSPRPGSAKPDGNGCRLWLTDTWEHS